MRAFFDNNIAPFVAHAVHKVVSPLGHEAIAKLDRFSRDAQDIDWLSELGKEGNWIVFTADKRILRNPIERRAFHASGLTAFVFSPAVRKLDSRQRTATILWHWDRISELTALQSRGAYWMPLNRSARFQQIRI